MSNASSKTVPWKPWWGLVFVGLVYYLSQIASGLIISIYPGLRHWSSQQTLDWLNNSVAAQFCFVVVAEITVLAALYRFLRHYQLNFVSIGLRRPRWSDLAYGLAAVPFYLILYLLTVSVVTHFVPGLDINQEQQLGFDHVVGSGELVMAFISLVVLPPLVEEIMVRGFLYSTLKKALPLGYAVLATSLLFAAAHLPEGGAAGPLYIAAVDTFVLSLVLIYLREKTDGLWASITLHAIKNATAFTLLFVLHSH
jgi:membrane protease YdiL (CAAX protease family)